MTQAMPSGKVDVAALIKQRIRDMGGINAIVSNSSGQVFGFGMRGEIWRLRGEEWRKVDSPTNVMLKDAAGAERGAIYACGQAGTILAGEDDEWRSVSYVGPQRLDFCSVCVFEGRLFVADGHSVRRLEDGELVLVDFGAEETVPSIALIAGFGEVLSIAGQEVWVSRDGESWRSLLGN